MLDSQTSDNQDIFSSVRGKQHKNEMMVPTIPKTSEQVPWLVMVFMATVNVNR